MQVGHDKRNGYHFDSMNFTAKGVPFLITGTQVNDKGQTIDSVKNMETGKHKELERSILAKLILNDAR